MHKTNKTILHFHPNKKMSARFIKPLIDCERKNEINSKLISSHDDFLKSDITIMTFFLFPIILIKNLLIIKKYKPNLIITHNSRASLLILICAKISNTNNIYFNHGLPYLGYKGLLKFILLCIEKLNLFFADTIITVSNDMKKSLEKITKKNISIIHNGSCCGIEISNTKKDEKFTQNIKNKNIFNTAFIGRYVKRKGLHVALKLWNDYFSNKKNFRLYLYGENKTIRLENSNVFNMGFSKKILEKFKNIDCLILPSYHEGLSYVILESIASYCPFVANKILGVQELHDTKIGFLVNDNNLEEYAKYINLIQSGKFKVDKKTCNRIIKKYDRQIFLKHYISFINSKFN